MTLSPDTRYWLGWIVLGSLFLVGQYWAVRLALRHETLHGIKQNRVPFAEKS